ncbi:MAG: carboxypeptidase regulatory-like domain-containing protein [Bryobacterales bacterium]|nr:carboxypeptidase regulatory-like domain-containing protein [Bryobacterales bacterium]
MRYTRNGLQILALAMAGLVLSAGLLAQNKSREERRAEANSRAVQGLVTSAGDQPVTGAVVQLKDMRTLQVRSYITQSDGAYHFSGLRMDIEYQVTAKSGDATAGPRSLSIFDTRKDAVMHLKLDKK